MISSINMSIRVLVVSDTRSSGDAKDTAGPKLMEKLHVLFPYAEVACNTIPDDKAEIKSYLQKYAKQDIDVVFTTGGTGFSPRDVTPEATREVIEKEAPGLATAMMFRSLAKTEMAMLSRAVCGVASKTLIVNLPGSPKGALECLDFIKEAIPHAVNCINDRKEEVAREHITISQQPVAQPQEQSSASKEAREDVTISQQPGAQLQEQSSPSRVKVNKVAARNRESPYPMVEEKDASDVIIKHCMPIHETDTVPFEESFGRVLAENVCTPEPIPAFRASIKDGYAVKSADGMGKRTVKQKAIAGDKPIEDELQHGEAVRISTGAPVPPGADAVVQVEDTKLLQASEDGSEEIAIEILKEPKAGQDIRDIGSEVAKDSVVLHKYDRIDAAHIGIMAQLGKLEVKVVRRPAVGILSTGNEIKEPWERIQPGQIRDSNRYTLKHMLRKFGFHSMDCGIVKDDPNVVKQALEKAFEQNEYVITTGGASMGEFDVVKRVLEVDFDARIHFGRVNMKPGKPTSFATLVYKGKLKKVFCLPGNPASCSVCCLLFVIPALRYVENQRDYKFPMIRADVPEKVPNSDARPDYRRVTVEAKDGIISAYSNGNQISSNLNSVCNANGLAIIQPQSTIPQRPIHSPFGTTYVSEVPLEQVIVLFDNIYEY
ncbi:unnamed protein product [Callosobruchus maculatus]|uniref:MoaB/Mog domain-containing protein n=1 Tax=Callosobruchus maculatus TaxID=64391 RepID=A0A653DUU6_CALMS|nr:unnamed protein product [Callosobruchus maculatus]